MTQAPKGPNLTHSQGEAIMPAKSVLILSLCGAIVAGPVFAAPSGSTSLPATSRPAVDVDAAFRGGVDALQAKDYAKAEKNFDDVLSIAPAHPEANYYMALAKIGLGKSKNSVRYLEKAIKARGNFVEAREKLAIVRIELGEPDAAREQLAAIENLKEKCATAGDCDAAYTERVDLAITRINAALAPSENAPPETDGGEGEQSSLLFAPRDEGVAHYAAAVRLINQGRYASAIEDLQKAEAVVGPHPDILNYLGFAHRKLGLMNEAKEYYAAALAIDPDHKGANEYLGELYLELGAIDKAKAQLARLDRICGFGCAEREDLARLIQRREGAIAAS
jgi:tetratricopeptide (TPR) repeat protein